MHSLRDQRQRGTEEPSRNGVRGHEREESRPLQQLSGFPQTIQAMMKTVLPDQPVEAFLPGQPVWQMRDDQPASRFQDAMELLQRFVIHRNMLEHTGADDDVK